MKRLIAACLAIALLISNSLTVYACDEKQSSNRVAEIVFGYDAVKYSSDENGKMLLTAVYLCSEQADNQGKDKLDYLKKNKVKKIPAINTININNNELLECSHIKWESEYLLNSKARNNRKKILQNTVNKVFDFGKFNNWFGSDSGKCDSFAAILYYSHILADYLADDPDDTTANVGGKNVDGYSGAAYIELNGNIPQFTSDQKKSTVPVIYPGALDNLNRCGAVYANIGKESMDFVGPRPSNLPDPVGWKQKEYPDLMDTKGVYNRCHLVGRRFCGIDNLHNLITGTRYLNDTMTVFEDRVAKHIEKTNNHVAYRVTPIYKGDNLIASGVQIEAYSIEDAGELSFNVYCYNVQPGIDINYLTGDNESADVIYNSAKSIPFAVSNPTEDNPDLIYEMRKHFEILFEDQKNSGLYTMLMGNIDSIAYEARFGAKMDENPAKQYIRMKECEYKYYETLKTYVPELLKNEDFFKETFR